MNGVLLRVLAGVAPPVECISGTCKVIPSWRGPVSSDLLTAISIMVSLVVVVALFAYAVYSHEKRMNAMLEELRKQK